MIGTPGRAFRLRTGSTSNGFRRWNACKDNLAFIHGIYGTQRLVLGHYPFSIVFRELLHEIQIVAVAHAKRRPGYWAFRL